MAKWDVELKLLMWKRNLAGRDHFDQQSSFQRIYFYLNFGFSPGAGWLHWLVISWNTHRLSAKYCNENMWEVFLLKKIIGSNNPDNFLEWFH